MPAPIKLVAKRALGALYSLRPRPPQRRIVLLYHALGDGPLALDQASFQRQMRWLSSAAEIMPLADMLAGGGTRPLQAAITFDDGYASLHSVALPVLQGIGATATAFLNTGWIGTEARRASDPARGHYPQEQFLLWREVAELAAAGWAIASHGADHLDLTIQPDDIVRQQLRASRAHIETVLGACAPVFSYTWGRHTPRLRRLVAEAGHTHGLAAVHGALGRKSDRMALPRINIAADYSLDDFKAVVRGDWDYLGWLQSARMTAVM